MFAKRESAKRSLCLCRLLRHALPAATPSLGGFAQELLPLEMPLGIQRAAWNGVRSRSMDAVQLKSGATHPMPGSVQAHVSLQDSFTQAAAHPAAKQYA